MLCLLAVLSYAADLEELEILRAGYPRAFFFRAAEGAARSRRFSYEQWERCFLRLNGIIGKVLNEEVPNTSQTNIPYFTQYKRRHPEKLVLLHYNGNARDPRDNTEAFFAGHWLYYNGCRVLSDVPAQAGTCSIKVEETSLFQVNMGRYKDKNEDLAICRLGPNGKPDWSYAEQLQLLAIDAQNKTLTVRRGAFGTKPLNFQANRAYIAAHVTEGPWGKRSNLLWYYNYATCCPKDGQGRNCVDVLVDDFARRFLPGGALESFDGVEFDVLRFVLPPSGRRGPDADADGRPDSGIVGGRNLYGIGVYEFCRKLREKLGPNKLILADGASWRHQRSFGVLNGIESEGWPVLSDPEINDWSGGLNRHNFWRENSFKPSFHYVNHKFVRQGKTLRVSSNITRLVLAACQFTDAAVTYSLSPRAERGEIIGVYDELWLGEEHRTNWLGAPLGPATHLALNTPDLYRGQGTRASAKFAEQVECENCSVAVDDTQNAFLVSSPSSEEDRLTWALPPVEVEGGELVVSLNIRAQPMRGYPRAVARLIRVSCRELGALVLPQRREGKIAFRQGKERPLDRRTGARLDYLGPVTIAGETHHAYFTHPPYIGGVGYTVWEAEVRIPAESPRLVFFTALRPARGKSDGVTFIVQLRAAGKTTELFREHQAERQWLGHTVDLSPWAGTTVRLRFLADAGPRDNSVADHGCWGDVRVVSAKYGAQRGYAVPVPAETMTWANEKWFRATFYFRNVPRGPVQLVFRAEGPEPVYLAQITAHAHADAVFRLFERGAVLANPSYHSYTFDVARLAPGRKFRRIRGTALQDPQTNDGSPVGARITLGPREAIFLVSR